MPKLPGVNHLDAVRALEKAGFRVARQGKHIVMTDGTRITTGPVVELEGRTVTTSIGSKYLLGAPDPTWVTWMAEKGIAFDPAKPLRWKK